MPPIEPPTTQNKRVDPEMVDQHGLRPHHVADRHDRKVEAVGPAGRRIERRGPGRPHAAADDIGRDHEIAVGIDRLARPDHGLPPAGLAGDRMIIGDMLIAGQRMTDEDRVGFRGVERAVGLIGDRQGAQRAARVELERAVGAEMHDQAMRRIDLAKPGRFTRRNNDTIPPTFDIANTVSVL